MNQEKELDKLLKAALERRAADVPPLSEDFAERVLQKVELRRRNKPLTIALWVSGIAAALLVGFFLWPQEQAQQPGPAAPTVVAELPKQERRHLAISQIPASQPSPKSHSPSLCLQRQSPFSPPPRRRKRRNCLSSRPKSRRSSISSLPRKSCK